MKKLVVKVGQIILDFFGYFEKCHFLNQFTGRTFWQFLINIEQLMINIGQLLINIGQLFIVTSGHAGSNPIKFN